MAKIALAVQRNESNEIIKIECFDALDDQINETDIGINNSIKNKISQDAVNRPMGMLAKIRNDLVTPEEAMQYYKENKNDKYILEDLAKYPNTPASILVELAKNKNAVIRMYTAKNPNTSTNTLA